MTNLVVSLHHQLNVDAARYHMLDPMARLGAALGRDVANDGSCMIHR